MAVGIAVGDLFVLAIGVGAAQLALVVMLATSLALFLGSGQMFATQAAVSAALVATIQPPTEGVTFDRFLDALVGGGIALLVNALLLPADPVDDGAPRSAAAARGAGRHARRRGGGDPRTRPRAGPRARSGGRAGSTS